MKRKTYTGICARCGKELRFKDPEPWVEKIFGTTKSFKICVPKYCHRCKEDMILEGVKNES